MNEHIPAPFVIYECSDGWVLMHKDTKHLRIWVQLPRPSETEFESAMLSIYSEIEEEKQNGRS